MIDRNKKNYSTMKIYKTYLLDIYCTNQTQHIHDLFINAKHGWLQFDSSIF